MLMQNMARAVLHNYPDAYVMMLLVDERPESLLLRFDHQFTQPVFADHTFGPLAVVHQVPVARHAIDRFVLRHR